MSDDWLGRSYPGDFPQPTEPPSPQSQPTMGDPAEGGEKGPYNRSGQGNYNDNVGWASLAVHSSKSENRNTVELRGTVDKAVPDLLTECLQWVPREWFYSVDHQPAEQDAVKLQCTIDEELLDSVKGCLTPIAERYRVDSLEYCPTVSQVDLDLRTAIGVYRRGKWQPLLI